MCLLVQQTAIVSISFTAAMPIVLHKGLADFQHATEYNFSKHNNLRNTWFKNVMVQYRPGGICIYVESMCNLFKKCTGVKKW